MRYKQNLKFQEIYYKHLLLNKEKANEIYIENYQEIIYDLLKIAMYKNFKNNNVTKENIKKIIEYCQLIINYDGMPKAIVDSFKLILEDYKYLLITKNITYFFKNYYELKEAIDKNNVYTSDIVEDIRKKINLKNTVTKYTAKMIILNNKYNVLDDKLLNIFKDAMAEKDNS